MANTPDQISYYVVMIDYGRAGREAIVDPEMTYRGAVEAVETAMGDGHSVQFVHYIEAGSVEDISEQVFCKVMSNLADNGEPLTDRQYAFIELHVSMQAAQSFRRAA
jgi:hypothetical protein